MSIASYKNKSPLSSPGRGGTSRYFKHFSRDFHRSYGQGSSEIELSDITMKARLNPGSCYWLTDPSVAISTLAETLLCNSSVTEMLKQGLESCGGIDALFDLLDKSAKDVGLLNKRGGESRPHKKVKAATRKLSRLLGSSTKMATFKLMAILGACLYLPAIHIVVASFISRNPEWVVEKAEPRGDDFKRWLSSDKDALSLFRLILVPEPEGGTASSSASTNLFERLMSQ